MNGVAQPRAPDDKLRHMGNSRVYRIHTGDDLDAAYAMAQRLLGLTSVDCCPQEIDVGVETDTHEGLDRYLGMGRCTCSSS